MGTVLGTYTALYTYVLFQNPRVIQRFSKCPLNISFPIFPFKFFSVKFLLAPTLITTSGNCVAKQLSLFVLKNALRIELFAKNELCVTSSTEKPRESGFSGCFHTGQIIIHWQKLWAFYVGYLNLWCPSSGCQFAFFFFFYSYYSYVAIGFQG